VAMLPACGGLVATEPSDGGASDTPIEADSAPDTPPDGPCVVLGSLLCKSKVCAAGCAADICLELLDPGSGTPFEPGVCADKGSRFLGENAVPCNVCDRGSDLCIYSAFELVCVPPEVCGRFSPVDASMKTPCVYQDKSTWHSTDVIATDIPCPSTSSFVGICGGKCAPCPDGMVCSGISATSPFGVCAPPFVGPSRNDCWRGVKPCAAGQSCLTFEVGATGVQKLADRYGFCVSNSRCAQVRSAFASARIQCD
jgi:hypothetical protein